MPSIIFPFTNDEKVVALYQFRHGSNSFVYELPGGMPETAGERGEDAGLRELIEETGYRPKMVEVLRPSIAFDPASCTTSFVPVLAIGCEKFEEAKFDKLEIAEVREFPLDTWLHMVRYEPVDSKSAALTLCALLHLGYHLTRS
jgi:8-oxo-dGTP pyrophosphatase MutT (NUDIX family)